MINADDPRMAVVMVVSGAIHGALCAALVLIIAVCSWIGCRRMLRSAWAERMLNSGHYGGDHEIR